MDGRVAHSALAPRPFPLGKALGWSLGAHVGLVLVVFLGGSLFSGPKVDLDQKPIQARLVRKGKPRDEKLLPRKEELPPPPEKVEAAPPPPTPAAPPPPETAKVAIPGVKPQPAAKPQPQPGETAGDRRKKLFGAFDKLSKQKPEEELEGQEDGDELGDAAQAEGERYFGQINAQVGRHYDVSQTIPEQERLRLKADVTLKISRTGEVLRAELSRPSGNGLFDNAVLLAVKRASPFPPPPEHLRSTLQETGVTLRFTP